MVMTDKWNRQQAFHNLSYQIAAADESETVCVLCKQHSKLYSRGIPISDLITLL
jgi:hypothetical protein